MGLRILFYAQSDELGGLLSLRAGRGARRLRYGSRWLLGWGLVKSSGWDGRGWRRITPTYGSGVSGRRRTPRGRCCRWRQAALSDGCKA